MRIMDISCVRREAAGKRAGALATFAVGLAVLAWPSSSGLAQTAAPKAAPPPAKSAPPPTKATPPPAITSTFKEVGTWFDDTGKGAVQIFECNGKLCGRIAWLKDPLGEDGRPLHDGYNPDPKLRVRPICGLQVIGGLSRQPDGTWDEGWVYDPKVGKSYDAALAFNGRDLVLTGYQGVRFLSKSFTWTKAPPTLPVCETSARASR